MGRENKSIVSHRHEIVWIRGWKKLQISRAEGNRLTKRSLLWLAAFTTNNWGSLFGVDGTIIWAKHNCAGSWNDGDRSRELQEKLLDDDFVLEGHGIVADTAFPVSNDLLGRIITPLKEGDLERAHPQAQQQLQLLSTAITSLRQACAWGVGSIEKAWRQLLLPLPFNPQTRRRRLSNIFRLWNYRVRTTKISQIGTYFDS